MLIMRKNTLFPYLEMNGSLFEQKSIPFTQACFVTSLVEAVPLVLEKKKLDFVNAFLVLHHYLLVKGMAFQEQT